MEKLIAGIAKSLVDSPQNVEVTTNFEDNRVLLKLAVASEDLGKVIGKQGRTVRAMRNLLAATAARNGLSSRLEVCE